MVKGEAPPGFAAVPILREMWIAECNTSGQNSAGFRPSQTLDALAAQIVALTDWKRCESIVRPSRSIGADRESSCVVQYSLRPNVVGVEESWVPLHCQIWNFWSRNQNISLDWRNSRPWNRNGVFELGDYPIAWWFSGIALSSTKLGISVYKYKRMWSK